MTFKPIIAAAVLVSMPAAAQAPSWTSEQTAVWEVVQRSWEDEVARNARWPGNYVDERVVAWNAEWPMPRYRQSIERWTRFEDEQARTLHYEISPVAITMRGDTAVVHYTGVQVSQRGEERPRREAFGAVETLVRSGGQWRFLSLSGFQIGNGRQD